jgi:putative hydrolase of HD superfamily
MNLLSTMETKADNPVSLLQDKEINPLIRVYYELNHLKQLFRQGWLQRDISKERCESVADHTFGTAALAFFLADSYFPELDACQVLRLALLHDLGEIYAGDLTPSDRVTSQEKRQREQEAVLEVFSKLPRGEEYFQMWQTYENGATPEARFVRQVDRLEMALQASIYHQQGDAGMLDFVRSANQIVTDDLLVGILESVEDLIAPSQ